MSGQYFRAGIGAILVNDKGQVLALERADITGSWQLPQGGIEEGEEPLQAAKREIEEETSIPPSRLQLVAHFPELLAYELPLQARSEKTGRGQVQYWFLFRMIGDTVSINLEGTKEFRAWRWMALEELADHVVAFRAPVYRKLAAYFQSLGLIS